MTIELRHVTIDDWALFRQVRLRALADAPDAFGAVLADVQDQPESLWRERVASPGPTLAVLDDGKPVAMGGAYAPPEQEQAFIWGMWTEPSARGRGHGSAILRSLLGWCGEQGREVILHVTEGNAGARALYLSVGFEPTGVWEPLREGSDLRIEELRLRSLPTH